MMCVRIRALRSAIIRLGLCLVLLGLATTSKANTFSTTNLVTDDQAVNPAQITDTFLKNPWGITRSTGSPFWASDKGAGVATLYQVNPTTNATTKMILGTPPGPSGGVVIPPSGSGTPTGTIFNSAGRNERAINR